MIFFVEIDTLIEKKPTDYAALNYSIKPSLHHCDSLADIIGVPIVYNIIMKSFIPTQYQQNIPNT